MNLNRHLRWKLGYPYVYESKREGKKVRNIYHGAYWKYYARTGKTWRDILSDKSRANIMFDSEKRDMLDKLESLVDKAKRGNGRFILPNGYVKHV